MPVLVEIIIRCLIVYLFILFAFRLFGKRQIGQMTPLDLVLLLLLSNAVQNAMTGPDTSIQGGLVAAATLLLLNFLLNTLLFKSKWARKLLEGSPTLLINNGKILAQNLKHEQLTQNEVLQALREHGVARVEDVRIAVLELDGSISVVRHDDLVEGHSSRPHHRVRILKHQG